MNIAKAREYFALGVLASVEMIRDPMTTGWLVVIVGKSGDSWTLQTARNEARSFASVDTAVSTIEEIGFRCTALRVAH